MSFNSRPHEEVDPAFDVAMVGNDGFQFTTSRGGRLSVTADDISIRDLSIHDLTRRSTTQTVRSDAVRHLSIHDLTRRSTSRTARKGARENLSIHDLTRRSTANIHNYRQYSYTLFSILYKPLLFKSF